MNEEDCQSNTDYKIIIMNLLFFKLLCESILNSVFCILYSRCSWFSLLFHIIFNNNCCVVSIAHHKIFLFIILFSFSLSPPSWTSYLLHTYLKFFILSLWYHSQSQFWNDSSFFFFSCRFSFSVFWLSLFPYFLCAFELKSTHTYSGVAEIFPK